MGAPATVPEARSNPRPPGARPHTFVAWTVLGVAGAVGMVLTGTRIGSVPQPAHVLWWFSIPDLRSPLASVGFYLSVALLIGGWLGVGRQALLGRMTQGRAWLALAGWGLPFLVGPPLFSRDLYSYVGQGVLAHRGLNPYTVSPSALGSGPLLSSIASVWRDTTSPYGPLFVTSTHLVAAVSGRSLVGQVLVFRAFEVIGVALVMVSLPRLARHLGNDPGVALWLGALSPLALFGFLSSGHNDALMVGLLVAGVTLAVEGRFLLGLVVCALAATVKLPAAVAIVFLVVDRLVSGRHLRRWRVVGEALSVTAAVFVGVTLISGFGWTWLGPTALHIPTELRVFSSPSVSLGTLVFHGLHAIGLPVTESATVTVAQYVCGLAAVAAVVWLAATLRHHEVVRSLGLALILVVIGSPTVWPWYLLWGLVLLAATSAQRSKVLALVAALAMLVVGPSGHPLLVGAWYVVVSLAAVATVVWLIRRGHWRSVVTGQVPVDPVGMGGAGPARSESESESATVASQGAVSRHAH